MEDNRFELFCCLTGSAAKSIARLKAARMDAFDLSAAHTPRQRLRVRAAIAQYEDAVPFHADPSAACAPGARR